MKTKIFYSALFSCILASLLSSCSFLQNGRACLSADKFAQRKYYNFPRTKHSTDAVPTEHASVSFHKAVTEKTSSTETTPAQEGSTTASVAEKPLFSFHKKSVAEKRSAPAAAITHLKSEPAVAEIKKPGILRAVKKAAHHPASDSDLMLLLELILAIILPPLAVYLKGGKAGKWFWITLLLCILGGVFIGIQYTGGGGLFWAIAVVIAICYVFGIIEG